MGCRVRLTESMKNGLTMPPGITRSTLRPTQHCQGLVQTEVAVEQVRLCARAEIDDEIDVAALRVECIGGGRAEHIQALHAELAAQPMDFIAAGFDDLVHGGLAGKLCRQRCVQARQDGGQLCAEQLVHPPQPALLAERWQVEVVDVDAQAGCDVVADHFQPVKLFVGEPVRLALTPALSRGEGRRLLRQPGLEVGGDVLGEGHQLVVLVHGEADQGHEVGEDALPLAPLTLDFSSAA